MIADSKLTSNQQSEKPQGSELCTPSTRHLSANRYCGYDGDDGVVGEGGRRWGMFTPSSRSSVYRQL